MLSEWGEVTDAITLGPSVWIKAVVMLGVMPLSRGLSQPFVKGREGLSVHRSFHW